MHNGMEKDAQKAARLSCRAFGMANMAGIQCKETHEPNGLSLQRISVSLLFS